MKTITKKLLVVGVLILSVGVFAADVPNHINYQGLLGEDGRAVNGTRDITFRLYDAFDAEISFWDRTRSVEIIDGVFNELLGPFNTAQLDKFATSVDGVYLEIEVDSEVFPRQQMLSVGYAFRAQTAAGVDDNVINSSKITDDSIVSADIQDGTIQIADLDNSIINGGGVANGSITTIKLADGAVISRKIAFETIVSTNIKDNAIGSSEIATNAVDSNEIATDAVGSAEIATDAVGSAEIATDAVGSAEIATDAVGSAEIATDAVGRNEIATDAVGTNEIEDGAVTSTKLASGAIPNSIPKGVIVMWTGTIPPVGWALCDGNPSNGTPDLRNKFIVSWGSDYGIGSSSDTVSHSHALTITNDGRHDHTGETRSTKLKGDSIVFAEGDPNKDLKWFLQDSVVQMRAQLHEHGIAEENFHKHAGVNTKANSKNHLPPYYALAFIMKL